jgi:hypothetical protein
MNNYWRIQARHTTVCPRCRGYIKVGTWIVLEDGDPKWSHAVCPVLARNEHARFGDERAVTRTEIKLIDEGIIA